MNKSKSRTDDRVRDELSKIAQRHNGLLRPSDVVKAAQDPKSVLHDKFEWDQKKAAYQHWLYTARRIIASVEIKVVRDDRSVTVPLYIHTGADVGDKQEGYRSLKSVETDEQMMRSAMLDEFSRAHAALGRAESLAAYFRMTASVRRVRAQVEKLRTKGAEAQPASV